MSLTIAMVTSGFPDNLEHPFGGVESATVGLVQGLLRCYPDLDIHIIRAASKKEGKETKQGPRTFTVHDVPTRQSGLKVLPGLGPRRRIQLLLDTIRPDIVHVQGMAFYVNVGRYPSVLTVHGIQERDTLFRSHKFRRLRSWILSARERPARSHFSHIIAISGYNAQQLKGYCSARIYFISNAIDTTFFELKRKKTEPVILFAGIFNPIKNIHGIIEAVGLLTREKVDCRLRLAGPKRDEKYANRLESLINKWNIQNRVKYLGSLDRKSLQKELVQARCLVLPSLQEAAPIIIAEAAATGVPAVVSSAGGMAEMVRHEYSGMLADPSSPASIADGLRPLLIDEKLANRLGQKAKEQSKSYHPDIVAEKTFSVYQSIIRYNNIFRSIH